MNRRLQLLYDNAYISRIDPKREDAYIINSDMLYCLGAKGASVLQDRGELARPYSDPRRKAGRDHVSHTLLISDFMIAIRSSCVRTEGRVRFIPAEEILSGSYRLTKTHPLKIEAPIKDKKGAWKNNGTIPDELFGLDFAEQRIKRFYFFEADRGTMPQKRKRSPDMSAIRSKYETYFEFSKRRFAVDEFGFNNFSVLFFTDSSEQRAINARLATSKVFEKRRTWLFSHKQSILAPGVDVLSAPWVRGDGKKGCLSLVDTAPHSTTVVN